MTESSSAEQGFWKRLQHRRRARKAATAERAGVRAENDRSELDRRARKRKYFVAGGGG